jgi:hypothetical protein
MFFFIFRRRRSKVWLKKQSWTQIRGKEEGYGV